MRITKRLVDSVAPAPDGKRLYVWDDEIKGFGLQVLPSGVKSYVFQYRNRQHANRRLTIGKHGKVTAEQAREMAKEHRAAISSGRDPLAEKREIRATPYVSELLDAYLKSTAYADKAPSTQLIEKGRIERHLRPLLGKVKITELTKEQVERARNSIRDGKTAATVKTKARGVARVRGGPITARECIALLRFVFNWGIETKRATSNPCDGVKLPPIGRRTAILEDAAAYATLFTALASMEAKKAIRPAAADAIRVLALTGTRKSEIAKLQWQHLDLKAGKITLPPSSHKTGKRTGAKVIALPAVAQEIIKRQPPRGPDDYVFAPGRGKGPISLAKPWMQIRAAAGLPETLGLHGLRHSVGSHLAMNGAQLPAIMEALGHRQLSTVQRYIHFAENAKAALAETAAATALAGMNTAEATKQPTANIEGAADGAEG
ncbi:hypothetical protein DK847_14625 [Aestuariivirga litoralis]|uniref:Tyr recombinase domain-containing protein n=1 Tax=Aestuariivirga litoralis TaxID=2650924 RepID=A0A2W2BKH8_9HYPH|nr:site-specific integrase [Aestuariivirga litoralis]PZF76407.1 hypothetical protein DK847_14625 [Aestuariivirga litoralis]